MKLEEKDIKKLERVMRQYSIKSTDELIAVIERGQRFVDILPTAEAGGFLDTDGICLR